MRDKSRERPGPSENQAKLPTELESCKHVTINSVPLMSDEDKTFSGSLV